MYVKYKTAVSQKYSFVVERKKKEKKKKNVEPISCWWHSRSYRIELVIAMLVAWKRQKNKIVLFLVEQV